MSTGIITTSSFPKGLKPGVYEAFGLDYKEWAPEYAQIFRTINSDMAYEEMVSMSGFGLASAKSEGSRLAFDTARQGFVTRITNITYAKGFIVTMEAMDDGKFMPKVIADAKALNRSFRQTKEQNGGLILTRAFNSSYTGGDGKELCATDHPHKAGGTYSNELATPADLSETAIEQLITQLSTATDDRGLTIKLLPQALVVAPADLWEARRILESTLQANTANNAINTLNGIFPKGIVVNRYFDAGNGAWFITTDAPSGLIFQQRQKLTFGESPDSDTFNTKFFGWERYAFGWDDPLAIFGSAGAA